MTKYILQHFYEIIYELMKNTETTIELKIMSFLFDKNDGYSQKL